MSGSNRPISFRFITALCAVILLVDVFVPAGFAGGVLYLLPIFIVSRSHKKNHIIWVAILCSILTFADLFLSPMVGVEIAVVLENRALALFVIWLTAWFVISRKQVELALRDSEKKFRNLVESSSHCIHQIDSKREFISMNLAGLKMIEKEDEHAILGIPYLDAVCNEDRERISKLMDAAYAGEYQEFDFRGEGGIEFRSNFVPIYDADGKVESLLGITEDITRRKRAERALTVLSHCNHAVAHASGEQSLLDEVCQIIVNQGEYRMAGVGFAEYDENKTVRMVAYDGHENHYLKKANVNWRDDNERGLDPAGTAIRSREPYVAKDIHTDPCFAPWREAAIEQGYASCATIPMFIDEQVLGVLLIYAQEIRAFDEEEMELLSRLAENLAYGIHTIRIEEESKKNQEALRNSEEQLGLITESIPAAISYIDAELRYQYNNAAFEDYFKLPREKVKGRYMSEVMSEEAYEKNRPYIEQALSNQQTRFEYKYVRSDGSLVAFETVYVPQANAEGEVLGIYILSTDITERKRIEEQLSYQASHDALTGLINRHEFERRVERLFLTIKEEKAQHAMCYLDLDQFKVVNDTCGHIAGDEMLRQLSSILQKTVRHRDTLARLGGDEFGVLMEHCSLDDAHRVATSLQKNIQDFQFLWEGQCFNVGVSIGLVAITEAIPNLTELLKEADAACYMAKDLGRNRIHVYHGEDADMVQRHGEMQWVTRIQGALEEERFCLYAQTIVPLDNSTGRHYELLIRMLDGKGKIIPPGAFLPAAERYNLISNLDRWMVEQAFTLLAAYPAFLNQVNFISINLSGQSLTEDTFQDFVIEQFEEKKIPSEKICFEITETAVITNLSAANLFISKMSKLGCQFALDDFGSGLSSFGYLKTLPVDYLKIDGMFVKDIANDPIDHAMVKSINEIGHVMGMKTIAEFVENDIIRGMLKEIGIDYAQGYGVGKPQSFDELLQRSNNVIDIKKSQDDEYGSCSINPVAFSKIIILCKKSIRLILRLASFLINWRIITK